MLTVLKSIEKSSAKMRSNRLKKFKIMSVHAIAQFPVKITSSKVGIAGKIIGLKIFRFLSYRVMQIVDKDQIGLSCLVGTWTPRDYGDPEKVEWPPPA